MFKVSVTRRDLIEKYNREVTVKVLRFNSSSPDEQLRLARDPRFWSHSCEEYFLGDVCILCGRSFRSSSPSFPFSHSSLSRNAGAASGAGI